MSEVAALGELVAIKRGTTYKSALLGLPGPNLLGLASIERNGGFRGDSLKTYGGDSPESLLVKPGELFASLKDVTQAADLLGSVAQVPLGERPGRLTQDTVRIDVISNRVDKDYLYWLLRAPAYRQYCRAHATGTTNLGLPREDFLRFPVPLPPLDEQRRIADVLGTLDNLIATNERLIRGLVLLLDSEFARRFGGTDLGLTVGELGKVVDCLHSKKPERDPAGHGLLLQLNNIRNDGLLDPSARYLVSDADYRRWSKNLETQPHDLVVTNVGRVGAVARVPSGLKAALGRNMTGIRIINVERDAPFVATALLSANVRREIDSKTDTGTILDALNVRSIPKLRLPSAGDDERARYAAFAAPLMEACDTLMAQNIDLRQTRDELLPLLMSGAVHVRAEGVAA